MVSIEMSIWLNFFFKALGIYQVILIRNYKLPRTLFGNTKGGERHSIQMNSDF